MKFLSSFLMAVLLFTGSSFAKKKKTSPPDPKLCSIKTVAVRGNSESALAIRQGLREGETWMRLLGPKDADAIIEVSEARSIEEILTPIAYVTVTVTLIRRESEEFIWGDSQRAAENDSWVGPGPKRAAKKLFKRLRKAASCADWRYAL